MVKLDDLKDELDGLLMDDEFGMLDELKDELGELLSWRISWVSWTT